MFIRSKKIKEYNYAYLVKNVWTSSGPRQKSVDYLGRIIKLDKVEGEYSVSDGNYADMVRNLVEIELLKHGFVNSDGKFVLDKFVADTSMMTFKKGKKDVVFQINEGFMCGHTVKELIQFKPAGNDRDGMRFASTLLEAGLKVEEDDFVRLYSKIAIRPVMDEVSLDEFEY